MYFRAAAAFVGSPLADASALASELPTSDVNCMDPAKSINSDGVDHRLQIARIKAKVETQSNVPRGSARLRALRRSLAVLIRAKFQVRPTTVVGSDVAFSDFGF